MIAVTQTDIRKVFDAQILSLLPSLGLTDKDVAWPNAPFAPTPLQPYLRVYILPAMGGAATLGQNCMVRLAGVYQVSILEPKANGIGPAERKADVLLNAFPIGMSLPCCNQRIVLANVYTTSAMEEESRLHMPVSIQYECYAPQQKNAAIGAV